MEDAAPFIHAFQPVISDAERASAELQMMASERRQGIIDKILARIRIDPVTGCWVWQGPTSGDGRGGGYPRMCLDGQTVAVHRVMFTLIHGYVPGRKQIDHVCRNRLCVNPHPEHTEMVTHKRNQKRRDEANCKKKGGQACLKS